MHIAQLSPMALCVVEASDTQQPAIHLQNVASAQLQIGCVRMTGAAGGAGALAAFMHKCYGCPQNAVCLT